MKIIGITGGVGAGKTQILKYIEEHYSCRIIRADEAAHLLEEPGQECYEQLVTESLVILRYWSRSTPSSIRRLSNIFWNRLIMRKRHKMLLFSL